MKWFKHLSTAQYDPKIMRVIRKFGLRGYGLYFACLENISNQLTPERPEPDMEQSESDIAEFFGEDTEKIREIIAYFIQQDLFQTDENTDRLVCIKMLEHLDVTMSNNPQIKKILENYRQKQPLLETNSNYKPVLESIPRLDQIRPDQTRSEKKRKEKKDSKAVAFVPFELPFRSESFQTAWDEFAVHRKQKRAPLTEMAAKKSLKLLSEYSEPEAIAMIDHAIQNGWTGIFPLKKNFSTAPIGQGSVSSAINAGFKLLEQGRGKA